MYGDSILTASDIQQLMASRARPAPIAGEIWSDKLEGGTGFKYTRYDKDPYGSWFTFNDVNGEFGFRYLAWTSRIKKDMVVIDAGAGYGSYTLPALAKGAIVYAFEPNPFNYDHLMKNISVNGQDFVTRARCYQKALLDKSNIVIDWNETKSMETMTIDDLNLQQLDILKIDVEGVELHVLRGAIDTIRRFKPVLLVENHRNWNPHIERRVKEFVLNSILPGTYRFFTIQTHLEFNHTFFFPNQADNYVIVT